MLAAFLFCRSASGQFWLNPELDRIKRSLQSVELNLEQGPPVPNIQIPVQTGFHSGFASARDAARWVQVDLGAEYPIDEIFVVPATLNGTTSYGFPERYRIETGRDALMSEPELVEESDVENPDSILPTRVACAGRTARYVRFTALGLVPQPRLHSRFIFCLGEFLVFGGGRNVALNRPVLAPNAVTTLPTWAPSHLIDGVYALGVPSQVQQANTNGWHSGIFKDENTESWVQIDLGRECFLDEIRLIPAHPADYPDRSGFGFPRRFKVETALNKEFTDSETVFESQSADFNNPGDTKVSLFVAHQKTRFIRVTAKLLWERSGDFVFALGELEAYEGSANIARSAQVGASSSTVSRMWNPEFLVDGLGGAGILLEEAQWLRGLADRRRLLGEREALVKEQIDASKAAQRRLGGVVAASGVFVLILGAVSIFIARKNRGRALENLRKQISRDLHDDIGSNLCSIRLIAEMGVDASRVRNPIEVLSEIKELAREGTDSLRDMVWLVREGESPKIESLIEKMRGILAGMMVDIECHFRVENAPIGDVASLSFHRDILFIFREALHNIVRHSCARSAEIVMSWQKEHINLIIEDLGIGCDASQFAQGEGMGNMRYRASRLNGELCFESAPGKGTRISVRIPRP